MGGGDVSLDVVEASDAAWLLCCFASLLNKSCDPQSVARECVGSVGLAEFDHTAARLGLHVNALSIDPGDWLAKLPVAVQTRGTAGQPPQWLVLLAADTSGALTLVRGNTKPVKESLFDLTPRVNRVLASRHSLPKHRIRTWMPSPRRASGSPGSCRNY